MADTFNPDKFKLVCAKDGMNLKKSKDPDQNMFVLEFECKNQNNYPLRNFMNINLFKLVFELNRDVLEALDYVEENAETGEYYIMYRFKPFGQDLGIKKKYLYICTTITETQNTVTFSAKSVNYPHHDHMVANGYELIETPLSVQSFYFVNNIYFQTVHMFQMNIEDDLPIYMENTMGILIKKIYLRLKQFLECAK